jgi:DNA mismatch endonuclease, patch repair protein
MPKYKTVLFVHGCFWHQCPNCGMGQRRIARNREYWIPKLDRNKSRDARVQKELVQLGWRVLVVWECQATNNRVLNSIARKITRLPRDRELFPLAWG